MIMREKVFDILAVILILISVALLFADLSDNFLCNDEAFTAAVGRNVLQFGYPRAFDGTNLVYPYYPKLILEKSFLWISDTWTQFYLVALSFVIFGVSDWAARFPFVLSGVLTLILSYLFCRHYLRSKIAGIFSLLLLGTSVPFLLHSRQARYYGLVIALCFAIFYCYHRVIEKKKGYICLTALFVALSWTNHAAFVPMFACTWLMALFMDRKDIKWKKFISLSVVSVLFLGAWLYIWWPTFVYDSAEYPARLSLLQVKKNLEFQLRTINNYFMPVAFWALFMLFLRIFKKREVFGLSATEKKVLKRILTVLLCNVAFFTLFGMRTMRYYVQYLPFLYLIEAVLLLKLFKWKKYPTIVIFLLLIFTNFLSRPNPLFLTKGLPGKFDVSEHSKFRTYFPDYLYELTHEYTGPTEALCGYLKSNAKPGDRIKIIKGDLQVIFYNPELTVINDARYYKKTYPEWIVMRKYWNPIYEDVWGRGMEIDIEAGYLDVLDRYEKIALPAVDSIRENEPDNMETHFFRAPVITPENQMCVYRLKEKS
ncbi:MAG: glycosyltransferase family 39 protein [Candidatus Omnitrophica bacterium]|nr:glycosyltransferase family 39 protein [Candidatus Omnitrophota bacterium]